MLNVDTIQNRINISANGILKLIDGIKHNNICNRKISYEHFDKMCIKAIILDP